MVSSEVQSLLRRIFSKYESVDDIGDNTDEYLLGLLLGIEECLRRDSPSIAVLVNTSIYRAKQRIDRNKRIKKAVAEIWPLHPTVDLK